MQKERAKNRTIILAMTVSVILIAFNLINFFSISDRKEIYARVIVGDRYGFDVNGSALVFGMLMPGGSSAKELSIGNNYKNDIDVRIYVKGEIEKFLSVSENNFRIKSGETRNVGFVVSIPEDAKEGVYEGRVFIELRKHYF